MNVSRIFCWLVAWKACRMPVEMARSHRYHAVRALLLVVAATWRTTSAFNVDLSTASLRQGVTDSMFGFTVAQHVDHGRHWSVDSEPTHVVDLKSKM